MSPGKTNGEKKLVKDHLSLDQHCRQAEAATPCDTLPKFRRFMRGDQMLPKKRPKPKKERKVVQVVSQLPVLRGVLLVFGRVGFILQKLQLAKIPFTAIWGNA